jgi:methyl-accepting chemotaxis protein
MMSSTLQTERYLNSFLDKAENSSRQLLASKALQDYTKNRDKDMDYFAKMQEQQAADAVVNSLNNASKDFTANVLYYDGFILGDMLKPKDMEKVKSAAWFKTVAEAGGKAVWLDCSEAMEGSTVNRTTAITLARSFIHPGTGKKEGIIFVDVQYPSIVKMLSEIQMGKGDQTFLITPEGRVLSEKGAAGQDELGKNPLISEVTARAAKQAKQSFYFDFNGERHLVAYSKSPGTGITVVTLIPNSVITAGTAQILRTTILAGILFALIAGGIGFIFSLRMTLAMKALTKVMGKAENGDLTATLEMARKDEIGALVISFNKMLSNIRTLVEQNKLAAAGVGASSDKIAGISSESLKVSGEIAHAMADVAAGSSNQAAEIDESVKNVSRLTDRINLAVEKTRSMENDSESMKELSNYGLSAIESLNRQTEQTNGITSSVVTEIVQLNQMVKNINMITNVLRGISDQTNLLALNAAIEAARAGHSGKGFAVVADEIRKLAEQSNNHTREIQKHIETIFRQAQRSTELVGKAEASIKAQSGMVSQTAEAFSRINATTSILAENISSVGTMISEMDSFKEMVVSSMENISAVSEQVSASTQEVSAATGEQVSSVEQLDAMAKQLKDLAGKLLADMDRFTV